MRNFKKLAVVFAFSLLILGLPTLASAQWRDNRDCDDDDYGYGNASYNRNLQSTIERLKNRGKEFEKRVSRELDRNGYRNDNYLEDLAENFKKATDDLEDEFDDNRNLNNSSDEARQVLNIGQQIDNEIYRARLSYNLQNDWNAIRQDLITLGNAYGYNYDNRRNNNRRNNRNNNSNRNSNGNWKNKIPFPLPF